MYRKTLNYLLILTVLMVGIFTTGCKKNNPGPAPVTAKDLSKDTLYYIFKDEYLFTDLIPAYDVLKPRTFANNDSLFAKLTKYATAPKDRYSFIDKGGVVASLIGQGVSQGDFGIEIFYPSVSLSDLRVKDVTKGSPAYIQGIRKGWQITTINGSTNIAYDGPGYGNSTNINMVLNAVYNSNTTTFVFNKPDATIVTKTLNAAVYSIDPVPFDSVYTFGARKVGYLVFSSFIDISKIKTELDTKFANFASKGVTDLVIDLRYNGGGAVNTSEYMANLIAPNSVGTDSTKTMYSTVFNSNFINSTYSALTKAYKLSPPYQQYSYADLFDSYYFYDKAVNFKKKGPVNVQKVVFIVTKSTASASELLINNLKPYMNVSLIGKTTYGKPVGFFPVPVGGYDMYVISFRTVNANGTGDYYNGMIPTVDLYEDGAHDWGQLTEVYLNQALVTLGVKSLPILKAQSASIGKLDNTRLDVGFKGMIETRKRKLK